MALSPPGTRRGLVPPRRPAQRRGPQGGRTKEAGQDRARRLRAKARVVAAAAQHLEPPRRHPRPPQSLCVRTTIGALVPPPRALWGLAIAAPSAASLGTRPGIATRPPLHRGTSIRTKARAGARASAPRPLDRRLSKGALRLPRPRARHPRPVPLTLPLRIPHPPPSYLLLVWW